MQKMINEKKKKKKKKKKKQFFFSLVLVYLKQKKKKKVNVTIQRTLLYEDFVEKHELKNIVEKRYILKAKEEGEYIITFVSDRHCQSFKDPNA